MTGLRQTLSDLKIHLSTDKRIWSAAGFVFVAFVVWIATGTWREPEPEPPQEMVRVRIEEEKILSMIQGLNKDMKEANEERRYLKDYLARVNEQVAVEKQEIDWHVDVLVNKLNDMSAKVDGIALKVGAGAVQNAELDQKLKRQRAGRKKKQPVDRSGL